MTGGGGGDGRMDGVIVALLKQGRGLSPCKVAEEVELLELNSGSK